MLFTLNELPVSRFALSMKVVILSLSSEVTITELYTLYAIIWLSPYSPNSSFFSTHLVTGVIENSEVTIWSFSIPISSAICIILLIFLFTILVAFIICLSLLSMAIFTSIISCFCFIEPVPLIQKIFP